MVLKCSVDPNQSQQTPDGVQHTPNHPDIPTNMGVQIRQTEFTHTVVDENNKPLVNSPTTSDVRIEIPADPNVLETLAKGSDENSVTWFAAFWIRMIKKAAKLGWNVVAKKS